MIRVLLGLVADTFRALAHALERLASDRPALTTVTIHNPRPEPASVSLPEEVST